MTFDRREFLKKMSISIGAASLPGIGFASAFSQNNFAPQQILQIGGNSLVGANTGYSLSSARTYNRMVVTTLTPSDIANQHVAQLNKIGINAMLFGGGWAHKLASTHSDSALMESLPFVNSNFASDKMPESVSNHLIFPSSNRKIGVMGIGFGEQGQRISGTIEKMNQVASRLKNDLGCDEVYCLADDPNPYFQFYTLKDLVSASLNINKFFGSDSLKQQSELHVMQNKHKRQVLVAISNPKAEKQSVVSLQKGRFSDFQLI
ncbi:hypothetical protein [Algoriphagus aquimarinus]|uniref:hypothetical protein n=1 Tax=Algoriphagus aquimarinus TaxID=237018 RepID=UPI0030D712D5|tara:strand:- start:101958 stop:102743 length:786 start_codon:yes stop_codon:yes gene_type:complete